MFFLNWIKRNKFATLLLLVLAFFVARSFLNTRSFLQPSMVLNGYGTGGTDAMMSDRVATPQMAKSFGSSYPAYEAAPAPDVANRLVIQNSDMSLLVENVPQVKDAIIEYTQQNGGYMVSANISNPQDAPTATVTVRIPSDKLKEHLAYFRGLGIKVVSENLSGYDVTDEYVDIDARLQTLLKTKAKFEEILAAARELSDITNLNQQIINIQSQIDSLKGQQMSMEKNAQMARMTIYLSTDEIALPYAPSETFRPNVIFKLAVRSLIAHLRQVATMAIWAVVYAVVWVPVLIIVWFGYRRFAPHK